MDNTLKPAGGRPNEHAAKGKRPEGWNPDDFRDLSDGTLLDIYTTEGTDQHDAAIAEYEIERREKERGLNYDLDSQDTSADLIEHGYAVSNGKILYPTQPYRRWLSSNRETPEPSGIVRESVVDRLEKAKRERSKRYGARAMRAYSEDEPFREKIPRRPADRDAYNYRKAREKDITQRLNERRAMKERTRYETMSFEPEEIAAAQRMANLPLIQEEQRTPERSRFKFAERDGNKLYNLFEKDFPKYAPKWAAYGVSFLLENGVVDPTTEDLLKNGFMLKETDRIRKAIDPNYTSSASSIQAEANLKTRVLNDIIDQRAQELSSDELFRAKRNGFRFAIYSGAHIDSQNGKVVYSIPVKKGKEVYFSMRKNGIDPTSEGDRFLSYNGFVGIIEAIKNDEKATKKGFKTLDWYFDSFAYQKHRDELFEVLNNYRDEADRSFGTKLDEYWVYREQQLPRPGDYFNLSEARKVEGKGLFSLFPKSFYDDKKPNGKSINVFESPNVSNGSDFFQSPYMSDVSGGYLERVPIKCPSIAEKCEKALEEIKKIQGLDPDMNYYYGSTYSSGEDGNGEGSTTHLVVRFGYNGFNNVIAIPVDSKPRAMFCWRGKTGEDREGWRKYFKGSSRDRDKEAVKRFVCHGYSSKGLQALDQQWERVWGYLDQPDNSTDDRP